MDEEYQAVTATLNAFYSFAKHQYERVVKPKTIKYKSLSTEEQQLLPWFPDLIRDLGQCVDINRAFTQELANTAAQDWGIPFEPSEWAQPLSTDYDKVRSTLLQVCREWSSDGVEERAKTYGRLIEKACELVPESQRNSSKVLVPGCGLGRLVYEFVKKGFWTQGNEVSYHMLLASGFLLNRVPMANSHTIFPYIHTSSHVTRRLFQVRPVMFPDESPYSIFGESQSAVDDVSERMSMTAGSFVDLYGPAGLSVSESYSQDVSAMEFRDQNQAAFDIVATCFFLDTAHNVIEYLKTIRHCLKNGGKWINVGPFHWHFEGDSTRQMIEKVTDPGQKPVSVQTTMEGLELSREELFTLIEKMGFKITEHVGGISTTYSSDIRASSKFMYECDFWVAEKV
ncbi:hypothetical protein JCM33374_g4382 [Metschnikowia sp. JCM 33374]|nr:hypothetical protein JCM33374_g4382 [Metschnikowia sp. JCM 33374]